MHVCCFDSYYLIYTSNLLLQRLVLSSTKPHKITTSTQNTQPTTTVFKNASQAPNRRKPPISLQLPSTLQYDLSKHLPFSTSTIVQLMNPQIDFAVLLSKWRQKQFRVRGKSQKVFWYMSYHQGVQKQNCLKMFFIMKDGVKA